MNQAEHYESAEMEPRDNLYCATIPPAYTDSPYPLQYYFELKDGPEKGVAVSRICGESGEPPLLRHQSDRIADSPPTFIALAYFGT